MENTITPLFQVSNSSNSSLQENFIEKDKELYFTIAILVVNVFLCPVALLGNLATLIAIWKTPSLGSPANTLLSSLAVSDFAVGLIVHPIFIARSSLYISENSIHSFTVFMVFNIIAIFLCCASFLTVTAIGLDRLLAVQLHLRYSSAVTQFRVCWVIIFIRIFSAFFTSIQLWLTHLFTVLVAPAVVTLLVINFLIYWRIYLIVRRHRAQIQQLQLTGNGNISRIKRIQRSALNTFLVYFLLLCCYSPFTISLKGNVMRSLLDATGTIILLNSSLNPLLYCWRVREIHIAMKHIFCR